MLIINDPIKISDLNLLTELKHLEIDNENFNFNRFDFKFLIAVFVKTTTLTLKLPKLKILKIGSFTYSKDSEILRIESDVLEILCVHGLTNIQISKPETVKFIELKSTFRLKYFIENYNHLKQFTSLEEFKTNLNYDNYLDKELISKLPNSIKKIKIYFNFSNNLDLQIIRHLLEQKIKLENNFRYKFKLYLMDFKLKDEKSLLIKFSDLNKDYNSELYFIKNYAEQMTDKVDWFKRVDYNRLLTAFNEEIPKSFYNQFHNIQKVILSYKTDEDEFKLFLDHYSSLRSLVLHKSFFSQEFYDNLPFKFNLLSTLFIYDEKNNLNYDFLLNFKLLRELRISEEISLALAIKILKNCKFIVEFDFTKNSIKLQIEKKKCKYKIRDTGSAKWSSLLNLNDLIVEMIIRLKL